MEADYAIRRAVDADVGSIVELLKLCLGEGVIPRDASYWSWKHRQNPFGESPCFVAEANGEIIALRAFMRWNWRSNGGEVHAVRAVDTATHPEWRRKGIFGILTQRLLGDMEREGVAFVFNTPNENSRSGYLRMGWASLGRTSLWLRLRRPLTVVRAALSHGNGTAAAPFAPIGGLSPVQTLVEQPGLDAALQAVRDGRHQLTTACTHSYLRWRYAEVPGFTYFARWRLEGNDSAMVVCRVKQRGRLRELRLCELLVGPTRNAVANARHIVNEIVRNSECDYVGAMASLDSPEARVLAACRFLPAPRIGPILTVRPLALRSKAFPDPRRRASWHLSIGALELL